MKAIAIGALAATVLVSGCAMTGQKLAYDPEGCTLNRLGPAPGRSADGPWPSSRISAGDPEHRTKANCTSNRALQQMNETKLDQQRSTAISFPPETPN